MVGLKLFLHSLVAPAVIVINALDTRTNNKVEAFGYPVGVVSTHCFEDAYILYTPILHFDLRTVQGIQCFVSLFGHFFFTSIFHQCILCVVSNCCR